MYGVQKRLNDLSLSLENNSIIFHGGYSYPFGDPFGSQQLHIYQHPDIIKLIKWTMNASPSI